MYRTQVVVDLSFESPRTTGSFCFQQILDRFAVFPQHQAVVLLQLFLVEVLQKLIGGKEQPEVLDAE